MIKREMRLNKLSNKTALPDVGESAILGVIFMVIGILLLIRYYHFMETAIPVTGTVTSVENEYEGQKNVVVVYEVDDVEYSTSFKYSSKTKEGDIVNFYCQPDKPLEIETKVSSPVVEYLMIGIGTLNFIIFLVVYIRRRGKIKNTT